MEYNPKLSQEILEEINYLKLTFIIRSLAMTCKAIGEFGVSLALQGGFGYIGAAVFTTINPLLGAAFGVTSALITTITKVALDKFAENLSNGQRKFIAYAIGILGGAAVAGAVLGTALSVTTALALFISILAAKCLFELGSELCCPQDTPGELKLYYEKS
jgi:hypothetical protein